jgi:hypothetical protein
VARVSDSELRDLVEAKDGERLTSFIDDAHVLVDETLATSDLGEPRMKLLEKYLAAHLWTVAKEKGGLTMEKTGDAMNTYRAPIDGEGLSSTRFGQQVMALDPTGLLYKVLTFSKKAQLRLV